MNAKVAIAIALALSPDNDPFAEANKRPALIAQPRPVKACPCSDACVCGCTIGLPCRCIQPRREVIQSPAFQPHVVPKAALRQTSWAAPAFVPVQAPRQLVGVAPLSVKADLEHPAQAIQGANRPTYTPAPRPAPVAMPARLSGRNC